MNFVSSERMVKSRGNDACDLLSKFDAALTNLDPLVAQKTLNRLKREYQETPAPQNKNTLLNKQTRSNQSVSNTKNLNAGKLELEEALSLPQKHKNQHLKRYAENEKAHKLQLTKAQRTPSCHKMAEKLPRMKRKANNNNDSKDEDFGPEFESPNSNRSISRKSRPTSSSSEMGGFSTAQSDFIQRRLRESVKSVDDACVVASRLGSLMARLHLSNNHNQNGDGDSSHAKNIRSLSKQLEKLAISMKTENSSGAKAVQ